MKNQVAELPKNLGGEEGRLIKQLFGNKSGLGI